MLRRLPLTIATVAAAFLCNPVSSYAQDSNYHVSDQQHLDSDVKWDYLSVDAKNRHLLLTNGEQVNVFDVDKKQIVGTIPNTHGVHGVAIAADLDRGFTSNGKDNSITIFALSTLKVIGTTPAEKKPDGIIYDPASKRVFAANGGSSSLTPVDAAAGKSLAAIPLGGKPEFLAVDGKGRLFVNLEDKNQLTVVDTNKLAVTLHYDLSAKCDEPAGLSIDTVAQRLFVGCHNQKMVIVDANTGKILDAVTIGGGNDATAYDETAKLAFASNGDGTLNIVGPRDATHYQLKQTVNTMPSARTLAIDAATSKVYLLAGETEPAPAGAQPKHAPLKPNSLTLITVSP